MKPIKWKESPLRISHHPSGSIFSLSVVVSRCSKGKVTSDLHTTSLSEGSGRKELHYSDTFILNMRPLLAAG